MALHTGIFQSTLPVRGATHQSLPLPGIQPISIHAPREGSDGLHIVLANPSFVFQSTLPVRGATVCMVKIIREGQFQSTLPVRGATLASMLARATSVFQSTLPVRGATILAVQGAVSSIFQSTLPVRGATLGCLHVWVYWIFQSTLPVRGATNGRFQFRLPGLISIHAPREGSDPAGPPSRPPGGDFNPRSP